MKKILISLMAAIASVGMVVYGAPSTVASYAAPNLVSEINKAFANPTNTTLNVDGAANIVGIATFTATPVCKNSLTVNTNITANGTITGGVIKSTGAMSAGTTLSVGTTLAVTDSGTVGTNLTISGATTSGTMRVNGQISGANGEYFVNDQDTYMKCFGNLVSVGDGVFNIGASTQQWRYAYFSEEIAMQDATIRNGLTVGTNATFSALTASKPVFTDGSKVLTSSGTLGADQGGTGVASPTDHAILVGSGASAVTPITVGANGELLIGQTSADPAFKPASGDWTINEGGTNIIGSGKITSDKILDGEVSNADLAATAVTTSKMDIPANSKTFLDSANYATMRTNMGVNIGSDVQAYDADLTTWAGITPSANAQALLLLDYAAMRTNLNLVIGTDVQAYDAQLDTWATVTPSANGQSLVSAADYAAMRTNLSLVVGTDVQSYDADLSTYAGITPSANVQTLLGSATFAAARTNLGLVVGTDVLAYDANTAARAGTAGKSCTNTWYSGPADAITNVQIFINGLLTSWTTNGYEIP